MTMERKALILSCACSRRKDNGHKRISKILLCKRRCDRNGRSGRYCLIRCHAILLCVARYFDNVALLEGLTVRERFNDYCFCTSFSVCVECACRVGHCPACVRGYGLRSEELEPVTGTEYPAHLCVDTRLPCSFVRCKGAKSHQAAHYVAVYHEMEIVKRGFVVEQDRVYPCYVGYRGS